MKITDYPNIQNAVITMAANNGIINRTTPVETVLAQAETALGADGVATVDVAVLEAWLSTLAQEQIDTVVDGEETEADTLARESPLSAVSGKPVAFLLIDVYEAICT